MLLPRDVDVEALSREELGRLVAELLGEVVRLRDENAALKEEIARLKGLKGRPKLKPSGMERASAGRAPRTQPPKRGKTTKRVVHEERVLAITAPPGSRFKGYEDIVIQDLRLEARVIRYRRQRWLTPEGRTLVAPLPAGIQGHFGPELHRFVVLQHHQGQVTAERITAFLSSLGVTISKSRRNFLEILRAGHDDYVVNDDAFAYMHQHGLAGPVIALLAAHPIRRFAARPAWQAHLEALGITRLEVTPDPVKLATEGALWGSIRSHRLLEHTVIVSDDAGQFRIGQHALCWVHAERLVHQLLPFNDRQRRAIDLVRQLIWWFYADLKAYRRDPCRKRRGQLRVRFERIFRRRTGFITLDRLLARLHARKDELLLVLERPEIPLHTNGSENDLRAHVTKRKISGGTWSEAGRDARDACLGLMKTCHKQGLTFFDYLGARLGVPEAPLIPPLPDLVRARATP